MLTMSHTQTLEIFDKAAPNKRRQVVGRTMGPWTVYNTKSPHTKWAVHDTATGMRIFHACPTLTEAKHLLTKLPDLEVAGYDIHWGDATAYTRDSIRAVAEIVRPKVATWTNKK